MKLKDLKKIAEELEEIVEPVDDDDNPISLAKGKAKDIEENIKEAAELLEDLDEDVQEDCSEELIAGLIELDCAPSWATDEEEEDEDSDEDEDEDDEDEDSDEDEDEDESEGIDFDEMSKKELLAFCKENEIELTAKDKKLKLEKLRECVADKYGDADADEEDEDDTEESEHSWDDIKDLTYKKLKKFCKDNDLITDPDDYDAKDEEEVEEFKKDIAAEMDIDIPEEDDDQEEDEDEEEETSFEWDDIAKLKLNALKKFCKENDVDLVTADYTNKNIEEFRKDISDELGIEVPEEEEVTYDSIEDELKATRKLDELQLMVKENDEFKKLRKKAKKLGGLEGARELKNMMYKALGVEPAKTEKKRTKKENKKDGSKTEFVAKLIEEGKYTVEEIIQKAKDECGCTEGSVKTMITHGKSETHNHRYKPFKGRLIKLIVCFED